MRRRRSPPQPAPAPNPPSAPDRTNRVGDCFVLVNTSGLFWSGRQWVKSLDQAERFAEEPDPARDAEVKAAHLGRLGEPCKVVCLNASGPGATAPPDGSDAYFVVHDAEKWFWTGKGWSPRLQEAQRFDRPGTRYFDCLAECQRLRKSGEGDPDPARFMAKPPQHGGRPDADVQN